jgi:hypothetical protein
MTDAAQANSPTTTESVDEFRARSWLVLFNKGGIAGRADFTSQCE